jgi:hypothetical protein
MSVILPSRYHASPPSCIQMSLGQAEVQIDTCTTAGPLEHLQRAAEMLARRQHREELALAERLCLLAALQRAGGRETEAAAVYERVLRVEEWGICEDASGGDQVRGGAGGPRGHARCDSRLHTTRMRSPPTEPPSN